MEQLNSNIHFSKLRNFSDIISDTIAILKANWKLYFSLIAIYVGPLFVLVNYTNSSIIEQVLLSVLEKKEATINIGDNNLILHQIISLLANTLLNGITYSFIIAYQKGYDLNRKTIFAIFNQKLVQVLTATLIAEAIIGLSFQVSSVLGLVLYIPILFFVYDRVTHKCTIGESFKRVFMLPLSNIPLSIGTTLFMFLIVIVITSILILVAYASSTNFVVTATIFSTLASIVNGFSSIIVALLYHTLHIQATNQGRI